MPRLRVAIPQDADSLDPTLGRAYVQRVALLNMCDSLFTLDEKLALVPRLATGYEWTDSRTLLVNLRPGVNFQDGTPVDAAAVKYNMKRDATLSGSNCSPPPGKICLTRSRRSRLTAMRGPRNPPPALRR